MARLKRYFRAFEASVSDAPVPPWCWATAVAAVVVGAVLRSWDLAGVPPGLQQDEAVYGYDAYSIFQTGRDHLGHPFPFVSLETFGDWSSPLLTFLSVPAVALFGLDAWVLRSVTAVAGTIAIPAVFLLAIVLFQRPGAAVVSAWLIAVSPLHVQLSRWAIIPSLVPTMVALTLLLFAWSMRNKSERGFVAAAVLAGITVASYYGMRLYVPLAILPGLLMFRSVVFRLRPEALFYAALLFTAIAGPILYLTLRDPGGGARFAQTSVFEEQDFSAGLLIDQYASYFSPRFWFTDGDGDAMHLPLGEGIEIWAALPLLLAGLAWLLAATLREPGAWRGRTALLLLALLALYPAPGSLTLPNPDALRAAHVIPLAALVAGAGATAITGVTSRLATRRGVRPRQAVLALLLAALVLAAGAELGPRYRHYFGTYRQEVASSFHYGLKDALGYVFEEEAAYDEVRLDPSVHAGYIYVLFYRQWPPSDVHRQLLLTRDPPDWNQVHGIGKYRFDGFECVPDSSLRLLFVSRYRDGAPAYEVLGGQDATSRSFLLVRLASAGR